LERRRAEAARVAEAVKPPPCRPFQKRWVVGTTEKSYEIMPEPGSVERISPVFLVARERLERAITLPAE
jgi:hypothetical protein